MRGQKKTAADLAAATGLPEQRLAEWLAAETKQLDLSEQPKVMRVVGLKESDLPEIMVHDFRKNGYLPEVLNNFLSLLGWSPGGDRERMSMEELVQLFSLEGIGKANAMFNREKLLAFNTEASAAAPAGRMIAAMRDYLSVNPDSPLNGASDAELEKVLQMNHGFHILREVDEKSRFLFLPDEQVEHQPDALEKVLKKNDSQGAIALREVRGVLVGVNPWQAHDIEVAVKAFCDQKQLGLGKVAQPIRVAVSGTAVSPPIFDTLEFLGRERTLARIDRCLAVV
jgi:glutamyl-tRNA synthetase